MLYRNLSLVPPKRSFSFLAPTVLNDVEYFNQSQNIQNAIKNWQETDLVYTARIELKV